MSNGNKFTRQAVLSFVGIFSTAVPSAIIGRATTTTSYKEAQKIPGDSRMITKDLKSVGRDLRIGVTKTKDSNGIG